MCYADSCKTLKKAFVQAPFGRTNTQQWNMFFICLVAVAVFVVAFMLVYNRCVVYVMENTSVVVLSMGRFSRVLEPGPHILLPTECVANARWTVNRKYVLNGPGVPRGLMEVDLPPVQVLSSEGLEYMVDTRLKISVSDIRKAVCCNQDVTHVVEKDITNCIQNTASTIAHDQLRHSVHSFRQAAVSALSTTEQSMGVCLASFNIERVYPSEALVKAQRDTMHHKMVSERKLKAAETELKLHRQAVELEQAKVQAAIVTQDMTHRQTVLEKERMAKMVLDCDSDRLDLLITRINELHDGGIPASIISNLIAGETLRDLARSGVRHLYSFSDVARLGLEGIMNSVVQPHAIQDSKESVSPQTQ